MARSMNGWLLVLTPVKLTLANAIVLARHSPPGRELPVLELVSQIQGRGPRIRPALGDVPQTGLRVRGPHDEDNVLDEEARTEYRRRLAELSSKQNLGEDELEEKHWLESQLRAATGLGGRPRKVASDEEKARVNVRNLMRSAIQKLGVHDPELAIFLSNSIKTGFRCSYVPDRPIAWTVSL